MSALNRKFKPAEDRESLLQQQERFQGIIDKKGAANAPRARRRLRKVNRALGALGNAPEESSLFDYGQIGEQANQYLGGLFGQLQQQGPFAPGDYMESRQKAADVAMSEFDRLNRDRFAREDAQFEQRMAEQGIPLGSEKYQQLQQQRMQDRSSAIQGARSQAFQLGQGEQAQAFGQAATQYRMPMEQLSAVTPYYGYQTQQQLQQGQQGFQREMSQEQFEQQKKLAELQNQYRLQQIAATPRGGGGGGLSYEQQLGLIDRRFFNEMVAQGLQPQQQGPGFGGGFAQGVGQGAQLGLGAALR